MAYDLAKATMAAGGGGYDLRKAAQTPTEGRAAVSLTKARQAPATGGGASVAKATSRPGGSAPGKAMPTKSKKKG